MARVLTKTKTTIVIDDKLLEDFRRLAASKYGTARMMSSEIEEALRAFSPLETIKGLATKLGLKINRYPSVSEVSRKRPRVAASSGKVVRKMRDERAQRLLGHQ